MQPQPSSPNVIKPTKTIEDAFEVLRSPNANLAQKNKAKATLAARPALACGPVLAYNLLQDIKDHQTAYKLVKSLYQLYGEEYGFTNYRTGEPVPWGTAFYTEAQLLWMRRNKHDRNDVLHFFKECLN